MTSKADCKKDQGKLRLDLIHPLFERGLAKVLTHGAEKYGEKNWEKGIAYSRVLGAIKRHILAWQLGEYFDNESSLPHLYHAACELMFLCVYEDKGMGGMFNNMRERKPE